MKRLVTYVINVDEDIAEPAYRKAIDVVSANMPNVSIDKKSIYIEPHDDYRGIYARVDLKYNKVEGDKERKAARVIVDIVGSLVEMQLWYMPSLQVSSQIREIK